MKRTQLIVDDLGSIVETIRLMLQDVEAASQTGTKTRQSNAPGKRAGSAHGEANRENTLRPRIDRNG
ncbi:hypothetical protein Trydic_g19456 [Trypoxylus dichotomus]